MGDYGEPPILAGDYGGDGPSILLRIVLLMRNTRDLISARPSRHGLQSCYFLASSCGGPTCRPRVISDGCCFVSNDCAGGLHSGYCVCSWRALPSPSTLC